MKDEGSPYGEARRLRYFVLICDELLHSPSVNIDFLIERILVRAKKINPKLRHYQRKTGVMRTKPVARNYVRFCGWLGFLRLDGRLVNPNSYTVFLANVDSWDDFFLSNKEKIGFFSRIIGKEEVRDLIRSLRVKNRIKDHTRRLSEHFVESFFEWFVDLDVLKPSSKSFGHFGLTSTGYELRDLLARNMSELQVGQSFASHVLDTEVDMNFSLSDLEFRGIFLKSLQHLATYTRSELDSSLYSVLPILLHSQLEIIARSNQFPSLEVLIGRLRRLSKTEDFIFNWDPLTDRGYVKMQVR